MNKCIAQMIREAEAYLTFWAAAREGEPVHQDCLGSMVSRVATYAGPSR